MKDVTKEIEWFRNFLNESFGSLGPFIDAYNWDQYLSITDDWIRLNWQVLVGGVLLKKPDCLKPLSGNYKGYYDKNLKCNYAIVTYTKNHLIDLRTQEKIPQNEQLFLDLFVTQVERNFLGRSMGLLFGIEPPFDVATLLSEKNNYYHAYFKDLKFYLVEWSDKVE